MIFCYDLEKQRHIDNNGVSTKGLGWRSNTYSTRNPEQNRRTDEIEKEFAQNESKITSGIDVIIDLLNGIKKPGDTIDWTKVDEQYIVDLILLLMTKATGERAINNQGVIDELTKRFENTCTKCLNDEELIAKFGKKTIEKVIEKKT